MSAVILPDGSLVFRVPEWTIHIDVGTNAVHLRDPKSRNELGGNILATAPIESISVVQLLPESDEHAHLYLEFETGEGLDLGLVPKTEMGRRIAYSVARVARCRVATHLESTQRSIQRPAVQVEAPKSYEEDTRRFDTPIGQLPTNIKREFDASDGDTMPRLGFHDEWRDEFIRAGSQITVPPGPDATVIDGAEQAYTGEAHAVGADEAPTPPAEPLRPKLVDGPGAPMETISAELVDSAEAAPHPRPSLSQDEALEEATVRIDLVPRLAANV
ncbi:MAG: hypothetical protein U1E65_01395 [Myxococcota bacterium]